MRNDNNEQHENGNRPCGKDSRKVKATDLFKDPWMPGLVHVEFKEASKSGVDINNLEDAERRRKPGYHKLPDEWGDDLKEVVRDYNLSAWEPSFPLRHSGSRLTIDQARKFYEGSGRQKFVTLRFPDAADVVQIAARLREIDQLKRANPVAKVIPAQIDDQYFGQSDQVVTPLADGFENQWYAFRCNLHQALEQQITGKDVVIAVIDWGFDVSHPDYCGNIALTRNVQYDDDAVGNGNLIHHGTGALGLAGARVNSRGMVGFAPDSTLWAIQAGEDDDFNPDHWVKAIDFVREEDSDSKPKVIILEAQTALRGNIESNLLINQAIFNASQAGIMVCVPAGNAAGDAGHDDQDPPEEIPETGSILVGASTVDNIVTGKTGERITVYAPGDAAHDLTCTSLPERYTNHFGGTSGAVAKVGGAVALLLQGNGSLRPAEVKYILQQSKNDVFDITDEGEKVKVGVLLDCQYAVPKCTGGEEPVLTKYSAMV